MFFLSSRKLKKYKLLTSPSGGGNVDSLTWYRTLRTCDHLKQQFTIDVEPGLVSSCHSNITYTSEFKSGTNSRCEPGNIKSLIKYNIGPRMLTILMLTLLTTS